MIWLATFGLVVVGYLLRHDVVNAFKLMAHVRWQYLLIIPFIQVASYWAKAMYYRTFLKVFGKDVPTGRLLKLTYAIGFINQVSPTLGVTGVTFFNYELRDILDTGKATLVEYGRYIMAHVSYLVLIVAAMVMIYFGPGLDKITIRILLLLTVVGVAVNLAFIFLIRQERYIKRIARWVQRAIDWITKWFRRGKSPLVGEERMLQLMAEFHEGHRFIEKEWRHLKSPLFYAFLANLAEVTSLYIIFVAVGGWTNPAKVIISYAVANFTGAVSIIPGDVGLYEVAMVATLSAIGVPVVVALSATLLYRVIHKLLSMGIGFFYYTQFARGRTLKALMKRAA